MILHALRGLGLLAVGFAACAAPVSAQEGRAALDALIAKHAAVNGVPVALVHRVIVRESRYNARAVGRGGAMGLMQIKHATARGMGYTGSPAGLLDPDTNLAYAVPYLAGAYRVAGGNADRAVAYYASGYYYAAKRQNRAGTRRAERPRSRPRAPPARAAAAPSPLGFLSRIFGAPARR